MARAKARAPRKSARHSDAGVRRYRTRGVDVEIRETSLGLRAARAADNRVELTLDGKRIAVSMVDGKYHCQLANQFVEFATIDAVVETLLANEGRTWTLHGHFCDERCGRGGHHHGGAGDGGHDHDHGHGTGGGHGHHQAPQGTHGARR